MRRLLLALFCLLAAPEAAAIAPAEFPSLAFAPHPGAALPGDAVLRDETGRDVALATLLGARPAILAFAYYRCPSLCGLVLGGLVAALDDVPLAAGRDFDVIVVGIDPREGPAEAAQAKAQHLAASRKGGDGAGWHFLTGQEGEVRRLADAAGFAYAYDPELDQYAHPAGIVVLTPTGRIARYLLGAAFAPADLRGAIAMAGQGEIAPAASPLLLLCYGYDPKTGRYTSLALRLAQAGSLVAALGLVLVVVAARRRERR